MAYNNSNVGIAAVIFGVVVFVVATGDIIFRVLGILIALVLVNYGLQLMGRPSLSVMAHEWFNQMRF